MSTWQTTDAAVGTPLELEFDEPLTGNMGPHSWTVVILPNSSALLGTGKAVKVAGTIDSHEFRATLLPLGAGRHMLPLNARLKKLVGKLEGESVSVRLTERL